MGGVERSGEVRNYLCCWNKVKKSLKENTADFARDRRLRTQRGAADRGRMQKKMPDIYEGIQVVEAGTNLMHTYINMLICIYVFMR